MFGVSQLGNTARKFPDSSSKKASDPLSGRRDQRSEALRAWKSFWFLGCPGTQQKPTTTPKPADSQNGANKWDFVLFDTQKFFLLLSWCRITPAKLCWILVQPCLRCEGPVGMFPLPSTLIPLINNTAKPCTVPHAPPFPARFVE